MEIFEIILAILAVVAPFIFLKFLAKICEKNPGFQLIAQSVTIAAIVVISIVGLIKMKEVGWDETPLYFVPLVVCTVLHIMFSFPDEFVYVDEWDEDYVEIKEDYDGYRATAKTDHHRRGFIGHLFICILIVAVVYFILMIIFGEDFFWGTIIIAAIGLARIFISKAKGN